MVPEIVKGDILKQGSRSLSTLGTEMSFHGGCSVPRVCRKRSNPEPAMRHSACSQDVGRCYWDLQGTEPRLAPSG